MGSPILLPTPWPQSPPLSHPESEEALAQLSGTVLGMPGRVLPSEHPRDLAARQSLCLYLQGGRLAQLPALEGGPGRAGLAEGASAAGGVVGVRAGGSLRRSAGRPRGCRSGREGGTGAAGGARRGGASTLLFPQPRPKPARPARPARPAGPGLQPPSPRPTLRHPHNHTHPGKGHLVPQSPSRTLCPQGPCPQGLPSRGTANPATEKEGMGFSAQGRGSTGVVAHKE